MKASGMFTITVPASTANLGPGFDSVGLAINRYLTLKVYDNDEWLFHTKSDNLSGLPSGTENLIYKTAAKVADVYGKELPPKLVHVYSDFPMSKGFGSSASAIVAGIELANQLLNLMLTNKEKARLASLYEGHPDNVSASIYGGLIIGCHQEHSTYIVTGGVPEVDILAVIPPNELKTDESRDLLPGQFSYPEAVEASSISNVLVAALIQNNWELAGKMMTEDLFHQPYRASVIPEWERLLALIDELPVYGAAISGAGPILLCFTPSGKGKRIKQKLTGQFQTGYEIELLKADGHGISVTHSADSAAANN
ncbi:homoserine kinase [Thalassobacillus pellis]|uniref:homoserine kinase n=1 Tax=Thalassobacillus pellis TaxID=748008 RepID=UPI0019606AE9|nr:homoserine kinase [Thalassobacillus pellis]MBM7554180.1 homoserine kinase [Thalassobacillus pellis]